MRLLRIALAWVLLVNVSPNVRAQQAAVPDLFRYDPATITFHAHLDQTTAKAMVWQIWYKSPVPLGPQPNRTVHAYYYQPRLARAQTHPVVICLHTLGSSKATLCRRFIEQLLNAGIGGAYLELPYHSHRALPGSHPAYEFTRGDPSHMLEVMRQSAMDVRCLVDWLVQRPEVDSNRIGLAGFSLGAVTGALAYVVEPRLTAAVLVGGGAKLHDLVWLSKLLVSQRLSLIRQGVSRQTLRIILAPVDACTYATPERGQGVLMINAKHDWVIPRPCTQSLWEALGKPHIIWLNSGHYTLFAERGELFDQMLSWLLYRFGLTDKYQPRYWPGQNLKLAVVKSRGAGTVGAILWQICPLGTLDPVAIEVGLTTRGGLVGMSVQAAPNISVGLGLPIGDGESKVTPYVSAHITF